MGNSAFRITTLLKSASAIGAALALLAGCAGMATDGAGNGTETARASCAGDSRPTTGSNIAHHDCQQHGDVVNTDSSQVVGGYIRATANAPGLSAH